MKRNKKNIMKRAFVTVLVLALMLSNVSVAAEQTGVEATSAGIISQETIPTQEKDSGFEALSVEGADAAAGGGEMSGGNAGSENGGISDASAIFEGTPEGSEDKNNLTVAPEVSGESETTTPGTSGENETTAPGVAEENETMTPGTSGENGTTPGASGESGTTTPGASGESGMTTPGASGESGTTTPGASGESGTTTPGAPEENETTTSGTSGESETTAPGASGESGTTTPETSGESETTTPGTSGENETTTPGASEENGTTTPGASGESETTTTPDAPEQGGTPIATPGSTDTVNGPSSEPSTPIPGETTGSAPSQGGTASGSQGTDTDDAMWIYEDPEQAMQKMEEAPEREVRTMMWRSFALTAPSIPSADASGSEGNGYWGFGIRYVNQDSDTNVEKDNNFNLKYQMEFYTDSRLEAGTVEIRIPAALFRYRGRDAEGNPTNQQTGDFVMPSQVAVPYGTPGEGNYVTNRITPFNYYIDGEGESAELVFFNYNAIPAGTNAAWQVLYSNLEIMNIVDGTHWEHLTATAKLGERQPAGEDGTLGAFTARATKTAGPLTGQVHSGVSLTSVSKTLYTEPGKTYTPGLYTQEQVERYIGKALPAEFAGEHFAEWKYVVWEVRIKGTATQPWNMILREEPAVYQTKDGVQEKIAGKVVGYSNYLSAGYNMAIDESKAGTGTPETGDQVLTNSEAKSWGSRFYVVTAYPAGEVEQGDILDNRLTVELRPLDAASQPVTGSDSASWNYRDYQWAYSGNVIGVVKVSNQAEYEYEQRKQKDYKSWLEVYWRSKDKEVPADYGNIPFTTTSDFYGYSYTHNTTGEGGELGAYIPGRNYELTTADDFMYAVASIKEGEATSEEKQKLDWNDYYYSAVTVTQTDNGYDVFEDKIDKPDNPEGSEGIDKGLYIYAMFAKPEGAGEDWTPTWELVNGGQPVAWDAEGVMTYTFTQEELAKKPWRVKAVHKTVEYSTSCRIDVNVCIRHNSEHLQDIMARYPLGNLKSLKLEDLSAVMGAYYEGTTFKGEAHAGSGNTTTEGGNGDDTTEGNNGTAITIDSRVINYKPYDDAGWHLSEDTKNLYLDEYKASTGGDYQLQNLPQRNNATVTLYGLEKEAHAFKEAKSRNDAEKGRVLVDYFLTAYDGYVVFDEEGMNDLKSLGSEYSPGKKYLAFYDLLPEGVIFDPSVPVKAGRIDYLDPKGYYKTRTADWKTAQVTVKVDSEQDVIENWNGTGRTMVIFHIEYEGTDPTAYSDGKWMEGWGVSFRAYYEWKDIKTVQNQPNIMAFMPDAAEYVKNRLQVPDLLGVPGEQVHRDNGTYPDSIYGAFGARINSANPADTYNVLYADCITRDDMAVYSGSGIEKLVRADRDIFSVYDTKAHVEVEGDYTYEIKVTAASNLRNLVIFDHLENAAKERSIIKDEKGQPVEDDNSGDFQNPGLWYGYFRSVETDGLKEQGADPVIWYNASRNAATTNLQPDQGDTTGTAMTLRPTEESLDAVLNSDNGWYKSDEYITHYKNEYLAKDGNEARLNQLRQSVVQQLQAEREEAEEGEKLTDEQINEKAQAVYDKALEEGILSTVKSVAIDLRYAVAEEENTESYTLPKDESVTVRIKMTAPEEKGSSTYALNNPAFYSTTVPESGGNAISSTRTGSSVRVSLSDKSDLVVVKRIDPEVEVPEELEDDSFEFTLYRQESKAAVANREYILEKQTEELDENGEKKWERIRDRIYATDAYGRFSLKADQRAVFKGMGNIENVVVEETESVRWKSTMSDAADQLDGQNRIKVRTWTATNRYRQVLYVRKELSGMPKDIPEADKNEKFTFQVKINGEIPTGVDKRITWYRVNRVSVNGETLDVVKDASGNAVGGCTDGDGRLEIQGGWIVALFLDEIDASYEVTEVSVLPAGQNKTVAEIGADGIVGSIDRNGNVVCNWVCQNPTASGTVTDRGASAVITNFYRWKELNLTKELTHQDPDDCEEEFAFQILKVVGDREEPVTSAESNRPITWELLDAEGNVEGDSHQLGAENKITAACAGKTIRISNLEAGATYVVREDTPTNQLYVPVNDTAEVWMPLYGTSQNVTITNDYRMRSLSVSKIVVTRDGSTVTKPFTIIAAEKTASGYKVLANQGYTLSGSTGEGASSGTTDAQGRFRLQNGQTATFENIGLPGTEYAVWEVRDENYTQIYPSQADGEIAQAPVFLDAAGNQISVLGEGETVGKPDETQMSETGASLRFVNGSENLLVLSKEYVGVDGDGKSLGEKVKNEIAGAGENDVDSEAIRKIRKEIEGIQSQEGRLGEEHSILQNQLGIVMQKLNSSIEITDEQRKEYEKESEVIIQKMDEISLERAKLGSRQNLLEWTMIPRIVRWENSDYDVKVGLKVGESIWEPELGDTIACIDQIGGQVYYVRYEETGCKVTEHLRLDSFVDMVCSGEKLDIGHDLGEGWNYWGENSGQHWYFWEGDLEIPCSPENLFVLDDEGYYTLKPYMLYILPMDKESSYTLTEKAESAFWFGTLLDSNGSGYSYVINQKDPKVIRGTVKTDPVATVYNEGRVVSGSVVEKRMTAGSAPVPAGKNLVWQVERYNSSTGEWDPANGIEYVVMEGVEVPEYTAQKEVKVTKDGGKIVLSRDKDENTYLAVQFINDTVYLNVEDGADINQPGADLRVVEVPEESDAAWGTLVGYGTDAEDGSYDMNVPSAEATAFVNSNQTRRIEIEKAQMDPEYTGKSTFTMVLQQVQRDSNGTIIACPYQEGIEYKLYDKVTGKEVAVKDPKTNAQGEISMTDGQYAILELPMELEWAVSENERRSSNFDLTKVDPQKGEGLLRKLDATEQNSLKENPILSQKAVLINAKGRTTVLTREDVENGVCGEPLSGKVTIPQYITRNGVEYEVVGIGDNAFANKGEITEVEFPPNLRTIGCRAFADCTNLKNVVLPDSVTDIGEEAFSKCEKLESVYLSESLTCIKSEVFGLCTALTEVEFPPNLQIIGEFAFAGCSSLDKVNLPDSVTDIRDYAFVDCTGLRKVMIPLNSHLQTIGARAFDNCNGLNEVNFPDSIIEIGDGAFRKCWGLKEVVFSSSSHLQTIGVEAFAECISLDNVKLPDSITDISKNTFYLCEALTTIELPTELKEIGVSAFGLCENLQTVELPEGLQVIDSYAFLYCSSLNAIYIPDSVMTIGSSALYTGGALKEIWIYNPNRISYISEYAFADSYGNYSEPYELTLYVGAEGVTEEFQNKLKQLQGVIVTVVVKEDWIDKSQPPAIPTLPEPQPTAP